MNHQERRLPGCPFQPPELWVDFNLAEFKSAGSYKLMHHSKSQKNDLFLVFKLRNQTRGVFSKIASYLGKQPSLILRRPWEIAFDYFETQFRFKKLYD